MILDWLLSRYMRVLGVAGAFGHDAAAALVEDGVIVGACEEERFTRQKRASRQPAQNSVQACLDMRSLQLQDVDYVAIGWDPGLAPDDSRLADSLNALLSSNRFANEHMPALVKVEHHVAHAALAYFTSGFDDAAVLVIDGQGERVSTTIYRAHEASLTEVERFDIPDSLGFFYAAITRYLGFSPGSAGKTMGLSALGQVTYDFPEISLTAEGYSISMQGDTKPDRMTRWLARLEDVFGAAGDRRFRLDNSTGQLRAEPELLPHLRNAAASAQAALERVVVHLGHVALKKTGSQNLVLSGGVALNCSANGRLRDALGDSGLFVHGAAHDAGTALGAALIVDAEHLQHRAPERCRSLFLGPNFDLSPAVDVARRLGILVDHEGLGVGSMAAQAMIRRNQAGAWYRGKPEFGPRALGGRSIVARPDDSGVAERVNRIKGRESWRPLAPVMSAEAAASVGVEGDGLDFMIEARWLADDALVDSVSGILHADRSVRPLVVDHDDHPFADLLHGLENECGVAVSINTSFNIDTEPMVNSPMDALRTFLTSDLDFLVLGDSFLCKPW